MSRSTHLVHGHKCIKRRHRQTDITMHSWRSHPNYRMALKCPRSTTPCGKDRLMQLACSSTQEQIFLVCAASRGCSVCVCVAGQCHHLEAVRDDFHCRCWGVPHFALFPLQAQSPPPQKKLDENKEVHVRQSAQPTHCCCTLCCRILSELVRCV